MVENLPKILIYYDWCLDIRAGGPPGYLANLRYGLDRIDNPEQFDVELWAIKKVDVKNQQNKSLKNYIKNIIQKNKYLNYLFVNYISKYGRKYYDDYISFLENIDNCFIQDEVLEKIKNENIKAIHCHYVIDALKVINTLEKYDIKDIKVLLTSHMPESPANENYNIIKEQGYSEKKAQLFKSLWENIQEKAFCKSDILVFPSEEAMEPYFSTISNFSKWIKDKDIRYYQTGAKKLESDKTEIELKKLYHIPQNRKVITYIGRHNEIKGYDILLRAGRILLKQRKDIFFAIGGKQSKVFIPPKNKNWKEYGWVNPADLLKISDVFVLPNKQTYFDLILLEVMSTGTPVISSNTGGNKSVQKATGVLWMFDTTENDLVSKLNSFLDLPVEDRRLIEKNTLTKYFELYTPEKFAQRYLDLIEEIFKFYSIIGD